MSIIHDVEQGSDAWLKIRLGVPSASNFHRILQPTTGKLSTAKGDDKKLSEKAKGYAFELIAEKILNRPMEGLEGLKWIEHGKQYEDQAALTYEIINDVALRKVGFITTDDGLLGCSPDRLIDGGKGGVEFKCPAPNTHLAYVYEGFEGDYMPQVQGQMYVAELDFVDRCSYHPELGQWPERTMRDDIYISNMGPALRQFSDLMHEMMEVIKSRGIIIAPREFKNAADVELAPIADEIPL